MSTRQFISVDHFILCIIFHSLFPFPFHFFPCSKQKRRKEKNICTQTFDLTLIAACTSGRFEVIFKSISKLLHSFSFCPHLKSKDQQLTVLRCYLAFTLPDLADKEKIDFSFNAPTHALCKCMTVKEFYFSCIEFSHTVSSQFHLTRYLMHRITKTKSLAIKIK